MLAVVVFFDVTLGLPASVFFGDAFLVVAVAFVTAGFVAVAFDEDLAEVGLAAGFLVVDDGLATVFEVVLDVGLVAVFEVVFETGLEF